GAGAQRLRRNFKRKPISSSTKFPTKIPTKGLGPDIKMSKLEHAALAMRPTRPSPPLVAIACGGTGGHLFPGVAVAEQLLLRGCDVTLLVSPKEVDQQAVKNALGMEIATLPAVGMTRGHLGAFFAGFWKSYRAARALFSPRPPQAVLAMGGFTSAPPVLAGKACGATTFLHESNTIPGKANR